MDVVIVSTGSKQQEMYWQKQLDHLKGLLLPASVKTIAVFEDWEGGAGNGFGTLYAYLQARKKFLNLYGTDLFEEQKKGADIAIYHTAGQGTRLYPLPGSEQGNKSAVKLPALLDDGSYLTILEAVIKQTCTYSPKRSGRLSVFWGDQIFTPAHVPNAPSDSHVEIVAKMIPTPSQDDWELLGLDKYGLIAKGSDGQVKLVDKCDYATFQSLIRNKKISIEEGFGISLGSFSLSSQMTFALLDLFKVELQQKKLKKIDTDPFFWMATLLDIETYLMMMHKKGMDRQEAEIHHQHMQAFKQRFYPKHHNVNYFGVFDIGYSAYWWDYGTIDNYFSNNLKLVNQSAEGETMRRFFRLEKKGSSCLINCEIGGGNIENSILVGVKADYLDVKDCLIINSRLKSLTGQHCLIYNGVEQEALKLEAGTVRADLNLQKQHHKLYTQIGRDGKADWSLQLPSNALSYREIYQRLSS